MEFDFFQVDAFSSRPFRGNPAAVVPLTTWLPDDQLLNIAAENNLSETAFFMAHDDPSAIELRWFTPAAEVALCGHATLATAHVLFAEKKLPVDELRFETRSVGPLIVRRSDAAYTMDFPAQPAIQDSDLDAVVAAVGQTPQALFKGYKWMVVMADESAVRAVKPDMTKLARLDCEGLIVTS
ncbi:MAG: PhzF family phenazine biosynthesis isomerase, partial [Myxococcota bacterium]